MTCSVAQALKEQWEAAAISGSFPAIAIIRSTDDEDNRFYQDGFAPALPAPPYAMLADLGSSGSLRSSQGFVDSSNYQLRVHTRSREELNGILPAVSRIYDCAKRNWFPETDAGLIRDVRASRGQSVRIDTQHWLGLVNLFVTTSFSRS